jgi:hypothetical protein
MNVVLAIDVASSWHHPVEECSQEVWEWRNNTPPKAAGCGGEAPAVLLLQR